MRMVPDHDLQSNASDLVAAVGKSLQGIAADLDAQFLPVGRVLGEIVSTVDTVLAGLSGVEQAFGPDGGATAIAKLLIGAESLAGMPARQALRSASIDELRLRLGSLTTLAGQLDRVIHILEIYTINVKIAAAGSPEFFDFADEMRTQLGGGRREVAALVREIDGLLRGLTRVDQADRKLGNECVQIIPAVPDRLTAAAHRVEEHRQRLAAVAGTAARIAGEIRRMVGAALGSIQIGDSARQRIEHVVLACRLLAEHHTPEEDAAGRAGTAHVARLCVALLASIREDFSADAGRLLVAMRAIAPEADRLLGLARSEDAVADSSRFIAQIEAAVLESLDLTERMRAADEDAAGTLHVITTTIETVATGVLRVQDLGREVGYMSVNANLRCRHNAAVNRPVSVIAREIKANSGLIDTLTCEIVGASEALMAESRQAQAGNEAPAGLSGSLADAVEGLQAAAIRTASGMRQVDVNAADLIAGIAAAVQGLEQSLAVVGQLAAASADLELLAQSPTVPTDLSPASSAQIVMERLKAAYTMACERAVHNRHLLPGMEPCAIQDRVAMAALDDDALF